MQNAINVSFRLIGTDGEVIALWREPEQTSKMVSSYMHTGQHSEAHESLIGDLLPASESQYTGLLRELESIGYRVTVI